MGWSEGGRAPRAACLRDDRAAARCRRARSLAGGCPIIRAVHRRHHIYWIAPAAILIWHVLRYQFITDDAYISFVYARNLAEHGELVFNLGDPVEGYSNFLWTVTLGVLMWLGIPPEISSQVLGMGFATGTLFAVYRLSVALGPADDPEPIDALAPALLSLSAGFACWSSGGLETQMFTFLVMATLSSYARAIEEPRAMRWVATFGVLAMLTRPEGLLVLAVLGVHRLSWLAAARRRLPGRDDWLAAALIVSVTAAFFAWRWWYYGYPLPNTYYVKAAGQAPEGYHQALWDNGLYYLWSWALHSNALFAAPLVLAGYLVAPLRSPRFGFGTAALLLTAAYLIYTASVGGDFMGLHRFVMPLFPVVALGAALGLRLVAHGSTRKMPGARMPITLALAAVMLVAHGLVQLRLTARSTEWGNWSADRGIDTPAFLQVYTGDRARIGEHMRECFRDDDFSIVGGAGAQPYHGRMRAIDVFGLVSERVAHEVAPTRPRAGHNKWAPDPLLAELDPEFVFSCYSIHRDPARPRLNCRPGFWLRRGYELVTLHIPGLRQSGEYYTFLAREDRDFECPGRIADGARGSREPE